MVFGKTTVQLGKAYGFSVQLWWSGNYLAQLALFIRFWKTVVQLLLFRIYLSSFLKLKYLVQLFWFRIYLSSFLKLKYLVQLLRIRIHLSSFLELKYLIQLLLIRIYLTASSTLHMSFSCSRSGFIWAASLLLLLLQQVCEELLYKGTATSVSRSSPASTQVCEELLYRSSVPHIRLI